MKLTKGQVDAHKRCTRCDINKPLDDFWFQKSRRRYAAACRECERERLRQRRKEHPGDRAKYSKKWREANRELKRERDRAYAEANREAIRERTRRYKKANREKVRAHTAVKRAIERGQLRPQDCESCGGKERIQAHHDDYAQPLEVRWLCHSCHATHHRRVKREADQNSG